MIRAAANAGTKARDANNPIDPNAWTNKLTIMQRFYPFYPPARVGVDSRRVGPDNGFLIR